MNAKGKERIAKELILIKIFWEREKLEDMNKLNSSGFQLTIFLHYSFDSHKCEYSFMISHLMAI